MMEGMSTMPIQACCPPLLASPLAADEAEQLAAGFKVLSDPARLQLLSLIAAQPGGACTCDLTEPVALAQPTVSHHLKVLLAAGLVTRERQGQYTYYRVNPDRLAVLREALDSP
jgi:ArsR family transcriptional regulator, arsenate/arsenite/antimonite-responsive transcriptional repressor